MRLVAPDTCCGSGNAACGRGFADRRVPFEDSSGAWARDDGVAARHELLALMSFALLFMKSAGNVAAQPEHVDVSICWLTRAYQHISSRLCNEQRMQD